MSNKISKKGDGVVKGKPGFLSDIEAPRVLRPSMYSNAATFSEHPRPKPECQSHGGDRLILKVEPQAELKQSTNIKEKKNPYGRETRAKREEKKEAK